jgi:hypothetical protein
MRNADTDAINLRENCTGRIRRIEIDTWGTDGVKVNAIDPVAHDLVVDGGYIRCYDHPAGAHQDGIQAMAGQRIRFRNLEINCNSEPNAQLFINAANGGHPTDVVCDGCFLGSGAATTLRVNESTRSGARNTLICPGRYMAEFWGDTQNEVNENNRVLPASDSRC